MVIVGIVSHHAGNLNWGHQLHQGSIKPPCFVNRLTFTPKPGGKMRPRDHLGQFIE